MLLFNITAYKIFRPIQIAYPKHIHHRHILSSILIHSPIDLNPIIPILIGAALNLFQGMAYLHNSDVSVHGKLRSCNCLIDGRFVLKISDFGLRTLTTPTEFSKDQHYFNSKWIIMRLSHVCYSCERAFATTINVFHHKFSFFCLFDFRFSWLQ